MKSPKTLSRFFFSLYFVIKNIDDSDNKNNGKIERSAPRENRSSWTYCFEIGGKVNYTKELGISKYCCLKLIRFCFPIFLSLGLTILWHSWAQLLYTLRSSMQVYLFSKNYSFGVEIGSTIFYNFSRNNKQEKLFATKEKITRINVK